MKTKKIILVISILNILALVSCKQATDTAKSTIKRSGEIAAKSATTFVDGVSKGIDESLAKKIIIADNLKKSGITFGKHQVESTDGGYDNVLVMYLIFNKDYDEELIVKVQDRAGYEVGRVLKKITAKKGHAGYYEFKFDKRTKINARSKIFFQKNI